MQLTSEQRTEKAGTSVLNRSMAIIGAGNMGTALLKGILNSHLTEHNKIIATGRHPEKLRNLEAVWNIRTTVANREAAESAEIIILCVKPLTIGAVLNDIKEVITDQQLIISIAAGITIDSIQQRLGRNAPIVRAMPNIASTVDEGATALSFGAFVSEDHRRIAATIFEAVGEVVTVEEHHLDAVTGLSGSGPAYIYMVIEALVDGGVKAGLSRDIASTLAIQTVLGSAKLVKETKLHPAILRDQVTTPAGTAINAVHELESHGLRSMLINAVATATKRSKELRDLMNG
ncbi:MAG TPA: pyrroline-5-carboxylate reductase [Bacteroidota bacterium]